MATYDYLNQSIVASTPIVAKENDSFFHPTVLGHTGFACDGQLYNMGVLVPDSGLASWYTETAGTTTRGILPAFPSQAVVVLSEVALTILAEAEAQVELWMLFIISDTNGLPSSYTSSGHTSYTPTSVEYNEGVVSVVYTPDAGSTAQNTFVAQLDFVNDQIYLEVALT